jgi:xylose isomerase
VQRGLGKLDIAAVQEAQARHDSVTALKLVQKALFTSY